MMSHLFVFEKNFDESFWRRNFPIVYEENIQHLQEKEERIAKKIKSYLDGNTEEEFQLDEMYYFFKYDISCDLVGDLCALATKFDSCTDFVEIISHYKASKVKKALFI